MCWDAEPTQPSMTSLERCTIVPGRLHPQPHLSRRLWALFFLFSPDPPATYESQHACTSPPAGSFNPPSTVTSPARLPYSSSSTTGTCSTCSVACDVRRIAAGSVHRRRRAGEAAALACPTRRQPGAASAAMHKHIFPLRAPMANLLVHPPCTADYQGHAAGGGKKGTERSDAGSSGAARGL
jgi:hypothetical protein